MGFLAHALIYLASAVIAVPLFKRLGLGSVLGYLAAGIVIGPYGAALIAEVESVLHFAELGVVLLLFVIGLELEPARLWQLRRMVFGFGSLQVIGTGALLGLVALLFGLPPAAALIAGLGLSLSSTAFALQMLAEKNQLTASFGRSAFGILLFQDLAVIPLLTLLPLLGAEVVASADPAWLSVARVVGVLAGLGLVGRFILRPLFRFIAKLHIQELFTATALLVVVGTALLVGAVGLSMPLGAFLAGVMLAGSEFRHELEADIEPFKGLLLGLFFIAVGMSVNLTIVVDRPGTIVGLVLGLVALKAAVLYGIGHLSCRDRVQAAKLGIVISQGGEFAFVLFGLAAGFGVMTRETSQLLTVVVSLSMATTPLLWMLAERFLFRRLAPASPVREFDVAPDGEPPVVIAGFGRVGQVVGRVLRARRIPFTAMDVNPDHIEFIKRFGNKVFYGDAGRLDLLRAARVDKAKVFVLAIDDVEASVRTAAAVLQHYPHLTLFARARNRQHAYRLLNLGVTHIMRETFEASVEMTGGVLVALGLDEESTRDTLARFRAHDEALLARTAVHHQDLEKLEALSAEARQELEKIFEEDAEVKRRA